MLGTTLIFGLNGPFSNVLVGTGGVTPWVHMCSRFLGATVLFWLVSLFSPRCPIRKQDWWPLVGASLTGVLFNQGLFAFAISMTSPINQALITTMGPIITMLLAALFLREPITRLKVLGVLIGASGVILLALSRGTGHAAVSSGSHAWGSLLALAATSSYCLYLTLFKHLADRYPPVVLMKWLFLISFLIVAPIGISQMAATPWREFSPSFLGQFVFVVFFATFVAYFLLPVGQRRIRPTIVSSYNYGLPVVATVASLLMGREQFTFYKGVAAVLVLTGVYLVTKSKSRSQQLHDLAREKGNSSLKV